MTDRSINHSTFTLERTYPADTARVFAAWADPASKQRWMGAGEQYTLDFQVGGHETVHGAFNDTKIKWETTYVDIVPGERITYSATLHFDDALATASLTTVEFVSSGDETRLVLTEYGAYLDGLEQPEWREEGTAKQLTGLGEFL